MNDEAGAIKTFFASIQVYLSDVWLESCINWCKTEVLNQNHTIKELQSKVYEQWLILDLRHVEVPCLPENLSSQKHFILNGNFCLQVIQVVDISKPKLWQLQKIRNSNALTRSIQQESDFVGTGKRMLQLTLTDGVQEVEAMEYQPVMNLNINLTPGIKIRIIGPVSVRRGRLMLEQQNVKVLGGEVEEFLVSHAAENVLARFLKLPENPSPVTIEEKILSVTTENENGVEGYNGNFSAQKKTLLPQRAPQTVPIARIVPEDEEMRLEQEIDQLLEAERDMSQSLLQVEKRKTPDLFEDVDFNDEDFDKIDQIATSTQVTHVPPNVQQNNLNDVDDDVFDDIDIDAHLDEIEEKIATNMNESQEKKNKTITIAKLLQHKSCRTTGIFKIKAKFESVIEKLSITEDEYKLIINIRDETGDLVVKLHSDIIAGFTGYYPTDILSLKSRILEQDESAVEKVMKAMQKVKERLLKLDNIMEIRIEREEKPVIIKLL